VLFAEVFLTPLTETDFIVAFPGGGDFTAVWVFAKYLFSKWILVHAELTLCQYLRRGVLHFHIALHWQNLRVLVIQQLRLILCGWLF